MTTCANALVEEIGLSSVGDDHESEDDNIDDYIDDIETIGNHRNIDVTVFLDEELPIIEDDDDDDEFGDDYVDANDCDADGRKLRLFSPANQAKRRTKSISIESAPVVLPLTPPRRSSSRRCSDFLKNAFSSTRSSSTPKTPKPKAARAAPTTRNSAPAQQKVTITKSGRKSTTKPKKDVFLLPETRPYKKREKPKAKPPVTEKFNALYAEFPKLQSQDPKELDDFFRKMAANEISNFNKTSDMVYGSDRPFIDKACELGLVGYKIPSRLTVTMVSKNSLYKYEFHGLITELKKIKGSNGTRGRIRVKEIEPPPRKRKPNTDRKQVIQPAPTRVEKLLSNAANVTTIKSDNVQSINLGNATTATPIVINNGQIQLGSLNIATLGGTGGIQVLDLNQLSSLFNNDGKQQSFQIVQAAPQAQSVQVVRPVTIVPVQNVTTFQNITTVKQVAKAEPQVKKPVVKVERKIQSPSPATSAPVSVSAAAANKNEETKKEEVKSEPPCEEIFIDTSEKQLMPPPPTPIMPKLMEEKMPKPILPNLAPSQVIKIDTSSNSFELMPPPAIPIRKLSIKDRLIKSPENPPRIPKLELVRKDSKKSVKEKPEDKVIVIKPTEEEKKILEESEGDFEIPIFKDRALETQMIIEHLDRQVEEKLRQERERAQMRMKTSSNILRRSDSSSRRSSASPVPAKNTPPQNSTSTKPASNSPKKTPITAPSSDSSPKKVAPKPTERTTPVSIKPTIIENNSTIIRSLPDGCQLLPIFNLAQAFTTISASNIITVVQSKPNKVPIPQNTSSSKIASAPSSTPIQSTTVQNSTVPSSKPPPVSIQPKSSNNPIEHSINLLNKANPGANEHKITLKIGGGDSPVESEPARADNADRFVSFKKSTPTGSAIVPTPETNPSKAVVRKLDLSKKIEPAIQRLKNAQKKEVGEESQTVTKIRVRAGSIGKNVLKTSAIQKQVSPIMRRPTMRKRTETFSDAHYQELMGDNKDLANRNDEQVESIRNFIADTIEEKRLNEGQSAADENDEFEDFDIGDLDAPVFMDNIQPDAFYVLNEEAIQSDPDYIKNLLRINNNGIILPDDSSSPSSPAISNADSPLSPFLEFDESSNSSSVIKQEEERPSPPLNRNSQLDAASKRACDHPDSSHTEPRRKRRKPENPVKIEEENSLSSHVPAAHEREEMIGQNYDFSSFSNYENEEEVEIKEEPMEYEEQGEQITPDRSAFIAQIEEDMKQEEEKFDVPEDMEDSDSESQSSDISLFSDIEMYEAEDEFEKELLLWRESGEADHIRKFAERSFTRTPTDEQNAANLEMLRAVGREFDNKYPAPEKIEKQKLSPDSGFDEESEQEVENKEEYREPLSPDSTASLSPPHFEGENETLEKQAKESKTPDRKHINHTRNHSKFYAPSKLDTPPATPPQNTMITFEQERNAEDIEALARVQMLEKIVDLESCPKVRDVSISHVALDRYRITKRVRTKQNDRRRNHRSLQRGFVLQVTESCSSAGIYNMIKDFAQEVNIRSVQEVSTRKHLVMLSTESGKERFYKALNGVKRSFGWKIRPADESILPTLYDQK